MSYWDGIVLGTVQGLTEFLPISSSGHLVLAQAALGIAPPGVLLEVALHAATLLAVVVVYGTRLWELGRGVAGGDGDAARYLGLLLLGSLPAAAAWLLAGGMIEGTFDSLLVVGINFVLTGTVLWSTVRASPWRRALPTAGGAAAVGVAQAFALFPGISRSGTTVAAALWLRVEPVRAAEFSFLLSLPAVGGAALVKLPDLATHGADVGWGPLGASFAVALATGVVAIRVLVALLRRRAFHRFAPYCWALGAGTLSVALLA